MKAKFLAQLAVGFLLLAFSLPAGAQSFSIDWYKISGGGGTSTGGTFSVSGTIGQHDAGGPATGGNFSVSGGFWTLCIVPTAGAPLLSIKLTATNTAMIYWPSASPGWTICSAVNPSSTNWSACPETVYDNGTIKYIIVNPPSGNRFYRLKSP